MIRQFHLLQQLEKQFYWLKKVPFFPILFDESLKLFTYVFKPQTFYQMSLLCNQLKQLPNIERRYHPFGGLEFTVNNKEFAHLHGNGLLDVILNKEIKESLIQKDFVELHHVHSNSSLISIYLNSKSDISEIYKVVCQAYSLQSQKGVSYN